MVDHLIKNVEELTALFDETHPLAVHKCLPRLDKYAREFISRSPFVCVATHDVNGASDVSPRGDPAGFVKVLNDTTLAIPDRPGNNRLDTMSNIVNSGSLGLLFMVPGYDDTLRVNGSAVLTTDPDILGALSLNGREPKVAILMTVKESFLHCAKAFKRSKLWDIETQQKRSEMPTLGQMIIEQTAENTPTPDEVAEADHAVENDYRERLY